jgi:hypothetical protein
MQNSGEMRRENMDSCLCLVMTSEAIRSRLRDSGLLRRFALAMTSGSIFNRVMPAFADDDKVPLTEPELVSRAPSPAIPEAPSPVVTAKSAAQSGLNGETRGNIMLLNCHYA